MIGKVLKKVGWQNKIDLSSDGLDDLKIVGFLIGGCLIGFFGFVVPWLYGIIKIMLLIIK